MVNEKEGTGVSRLIYSVDEKGKPTRDDDFYGGPSPEEWEKPKFEISVKEIVSKLTLVETKIFATLIKSEKPLHATDMVKNKKVGSNSVVRERLKKMKEKGWLVLHEEMKGKRRKFYELKDTEDVFFLALAVKENWKDAKTINKIAQIHEKKLPLIFGKLRFFKQKGIKELVLYLLSLNVGVLSFKKPYMFGPGWELVTESGPGYTLDPEPVSVPPSSASFLPKLIEAINNYPETPMKNPETSSYRVTARNNYPETPMKNPETLAYRVTANTFCLNMLTETAKLLPGMYQIILNLKGDQEIREWVNNYLIKEAVRNQLESDKIEWCINLWDSIPSTLTP